MKGQTIIELNNIKTGQKERYIDNNMVTNALSEYFGNGGLMNTPNVPKDELVVNSLGGLLLFDDNIQENANNIFPPSAINMIGNGCNGVLSSDAVTEMGSYNTSESGWQSDGSYVQVWDYTTSQANGTIACASLTSKVGGYIGWGNGTSNTSKYQSINRYLGATSSYGVLNDKNLLCVDYQNSNYYLAKSSQFTSTNEDFIKTTENLKVDVCNVPLTKLNLKTTSAELKKERELNISLPSSFTSGLTGNVTVIVGFDGEIYLTQNENTWNNNASKVFLKIDLLNQTTQTITLLNTTGINLNLYSAFMKFSNGYLFVQNLDAMPNPYALYRINSTTNEAIQINFPLVPIYAINVVKNGDFLMNLTNNSFIIDIEQGLSKPCNNVINSGSFFSVGNDMLSVLNNKLFKAVIYGSYGATTSQILRSPFYLATINNLETPVVKTPDKTMKVTYRLTF